MTIINKKMIKAALKEAQAKLRNHQGNPLSERYIEAKASIDCFTYVLELCKDNADLLFTVSDMKAAFDSGHTIALFDKDESFEDWISDHYNISIEAGNQQKTEELELVGTLNKPFGLNGFNTAEVGTVVYQTRDRYIIKLSNKDTTIEVPFYKETLAPNIDFYIA